MFPAIAVSENAEKYNEVLLNLSYSYVAGLVFFLVNDGIPSLVRKLRANKHIGPYLEDIQIKFNYMVSIALFFETQNIPTNKKIFVEVLQKNKIKTKKQSQTMFIFSNEINNSILSVKKDINTIESMLVNCYISSDKAMLLSEIRAFVNKTETPISLPELKQLSVISKEIDSHYWFPIKHSFRILSPAEASLIENTNIYE